MEQAPSYEAKSSAIIQSNSLDGIVFSPVRILSQMILVHSIPSLFFSIHFNVVFLLRPGLPSCIFPSGIPVYKLIFVHRPFPSRPTELYHSNNTWYVKRFIPALLRLPVWKYCYLDDLFQCIWEHVQIQIAICPRADDLSYMAWELNNQFCRVIDLL